MKGERFGMNDSNMVLINRKQLYDEIWKISEVGSNGQVNIENTLCKINQELKIL